ncbi:MAG TPA: alpha/beta hydrolase [Gaiellaceae bacterium]
MKVVLLHAFPLGPEMWAPQREALEGHDVIAPNLYELEGSSIDGWAEQIRDGLDDDFAAVGASMGGYVALALARLAPEQARGLLLAGARAGADDAARQAARNAGIETLREQGIDAWAPTAPAPPPPERTVEELIRATEALRDRRDSTDLVRRLEGPLWVVVGSEDPFLPVDEAQEIVASAPNGRLEILEGAGHFTNVERRNRFNELLGEFLRTV